MEDIAGQRFGRYEILSPLGSGGMGVVYRAQDVRLGRIVALKFLRPDLAAQGGAEERFWVEARAVARLNHPHIAILYEFDEAAGRIYLAMELLEGGALAERMPPEGMPVEEILRIGAELTEALAHAHARQIVHRDIKPSNVLFTGDGAAKITDFGLAKVLLGPGSDDAGSDVETAQLSLTRAGSVLGTISYMSPEQALGRKVDHRTDIFSLGVLLFQMASGRLPFPGQTLGMILRSLLNDRPTPIRDTRPAFPVELERAIARAMRREPEDRYPDMGAFAAALRATGPRQPALPSFAPRPGEAPLMDEPLVGREPELEMLERLALQAVGGQGQTVFLAGEAGIGKSRLIEVFGSRSGRLGARLATGRCLFREGSRPYRPVLDAILQLLASAGIQSASALRSWLP